MILPLDVQIEAVLFSRSEPVSVRKLAELCLVSESEVEEALATLRNRLTGSGLGLVMHKGEVLLGTAPEASALIEKITKEELSRELGRAALETLAIVLYHSPVTKREIDYIRGVNSSFILRHLLIRGLIERQEERGVRGYLYNPSLDLLSYLGVGGVNELPEYETVEKELEKASASSEVNRQDAPE
ncbi:SMC-Scp complex subunit ScpB [Patescibacteria group bacterium]|nr:MAG: SMC-Scp complex subunit ScpB [Patescibacteria group bacterium]